VRWAKVLLWVKPLTIFLSLLTTAYAEASSQSSPRPDERVKVDILVIFAHPDDETVTLPLTWRGQFLMSTVVRPSFAPQRLKMAATKFTVFHSFAQPIRSIIEACVCATTKLTNL
jgi:hypothetical protein